MAVITEQAAHTHILQFLTNYWLPLIGCSLVVYLLRTYFHHGLNRYPGPLLANFTNSWRVWSVSKNQHQHTLISLHNKYGPVVRTGPNTVDISDVDYIPEIYGIRKGFNKSAFYHTFTASNNGKIVDSLFTTRNERDHTEKKKLITGIYSLTGLQEYEPLVDEMIELFMKQLKSNFDGPTTKGAACDLSAWMQYYAFDVIFNITFGSTGGFMAQGKDTDGFIAELDRNSATNSLLSQIPWMTYLWRRNPIRVWMGNTPTFFPAFVRQQMAEHKAKIMAEGGSDTHDEKTPTVGQHGDMLTRFMRLPVGEPEWVSMYALQNVFAGSDTTAITLRSIIYFLVRNPQAMQKLMNEFRSADPPLSYPVTWKESQRLPYLHAVVEEALRLHPAVGLSLERDVPAAGLDMHDGHTLPAGTEVGMNAWVVNRNETIYGPLPTDEFIPERWLQGKDETEKDFEARLSAMKRVFMSFGWGKRICLGRNISYLEVYKVIPTLLLEFDVGLINPEKEWRTYDRFFVVQREMDCWLKSRGNHV